MPFSRLFIDAQLVSPIVIPDDEAINIGLVVNQRDGRVLLTNVSPHRVGIRDGTHFFPMPETRKNPAITNGVGPPPLTDLEMTVAYPIHIGDVISLDDEEYVYSPD